MSGCPDNIKPSPHPMSAATRRQPPEVRLPMFDAFLVTAEGRLRETAGLPFEDFATGQIFHHRPGITVTQQDNIDEALVTYNQAAVHYDDHYAGATEFGRPLVVSTLTLQKAVGLGWKTFGRRRQILGFTAIRLTAPIFAGDTLYVRTRIAGTSPDPGDADCGRLACEATVTRADATAVAEVVYDQSIYRRDRGPFAALGY
jgi:itaconyl-CoA hydratase